MQVRIPTRDCRAAIGKAVESFKAQAEADRTKISESSFDNLLNGALHNGVHVDDNRKREMREMVDRDVEHMMDKHPSVEMLQVLNNYVDMLAYHRGDDVVIDDADFALLKPHLPTRSELVTPSHDKPVPLEELIGKF